MNNNRLTPKGTHVLINMDPTGISLDTFTMKAKVVDLLAVQFTAKWKGSDTLSFLFYADKGATWRDA